MPSNKTHSRATRLFILFSILITLILVLVGLQAVGVQAEGKSQTHVMLVSPKKKNLLASQVPTAQVKFPTPVTSKLCGKLVFLTDYNDPTKKDIGLIPCSGPGPLIFKTHPRDLIPFYQFRDPEIGKGEEICTAEYGCIDQYLLSFQNYVGIGSCNECGMYGVPPTWTHVPLTPYTSTPKPPTATPYIPSPTPTETPTPSPNQITGTPGLFELLYGTKTTTPSPSATPEPMPTVTHTLPPSTAPTNPSGASLLKNPLVLGIGLLFVLIVVAYLIWVLNMRSRQE